MNEVKFLDKETGSPRDFQRSEPQSGRVGKKKDLINLIKPFCDYERTIFAIRQSKCPVDI